MQTLSIPTSSFLEHSSGSWQLWIEKLGFSHNKKLLYPLATTSSTTTISFGAYFLHDVSIDNNNNTFRWPIWDGNNWHGTGSWTRWIAISQVGCFWRFGPYRTSSGKTGFTERSSSFCCCQKSREIRHQVRILKHCDLDYSVHISMFRDIFNCFNTLKKKLSLWIAGLYNIAYSWMFV